MFNISFCATMTYSNWMLILLLVSYLVALHLNVNAYEFSGYGEWEWEYSASGDIEWETSGEEDIQCEQDNDCEQQCFNLENSQYCFCNRGFKINSDKRTCSDINECFYENGNCQHYCVNIIGSYLCTCNFGYARGADGQSCFDIDECKEKLDNCEQLCFNQIGAYSCGCENGYLSIGNNTNCIPDLFQPISVDMLTLTIGSLMIGFSLMGIVIFIIAICSTISFIKQKNTLSVVHQRRLFVTN